ncbi:universal stress protein [Pseudonocardia sp. WMMC193]|uniref:universal stress protein n=1 Tax=Pseudonocardia sp. WMMC193 TaxID=2911965 RepID=UPI001F25C963|nr:universal stress protein [Pseudonocardia sp. WMMC193]MCF7549548.1 universal stress protein [Pseudonocardia sp. WMMC193]
MSGYTTVVVGTDGSDTSFRAVDRAAAVASSTGADLVIVSAYHPSEKDTGAADDALKGESFLVHGFAPAEDTLRTARDRAAAVLPADRIRTAAADGAPVDVLTAAVRDHGADLLVVGNRGLSTLTGRLLGSVPSEAARTAGVDVLIVHTT